jgi:hypothetical protein
MNATPLLRRAGRAGLALGLPCLSAGCHATTTQGDATVYTFAWWVPVSALLACLLAIPAGHVLAKRTLKVAYTLTGVGAGLLVVLVPSLFLDRVVLDDHHFSLRTGFWFYPRRHTVAFEDLSQLRLMRKIVHSRGKTTESYLLECEHKDGTTEEVPVGDLMKCAVRDILDRAESAGVAVPRRDR